MPWGTGGGFGHNDHARMHAELHHRKHEIESRRQDLDEHHNVARAEADGERHRSSFIVRVFRRVFGRV
ncbi:MAG: hypothetical protein EA415_16610 [Sphaerobacteraceae bacterium]|nr:MAG: hypothetical protein EA415_16610 [Sphaerobacteraceae bacterium]